MIEPAPRRIDVLVGGAGPAGLATAIESRLRGLSVAVLEGRSEMSPVGNGTGGAPAPASHGSRSRVVMLEPSTLRALDRWAVRKQMFDGVHGVDAGRGPATVQIGHFERTLLARARELGVDVRFGAAIDAVVRGADGAVEVRAGEVAVRPGTFVDARGHGASAGTRELLRASSVGLPLQRPRSLAVGEVATDVAPDRLVHGDVSRVTIGNARMRAFSYAVPSSVSLTVEVPRGTTAERAGSALAAAAERRGITDAARIQHPRVLDIEPRISTRVAAPGITLVGDAAGTTHPITGAGLNQGVTDAARAARLANRTSAGSGIAARAAYAAPTHAAHLGSMLIGAGATASPRAVAGATVGALALAIGGGFAFACRD